MTTPGILLHGWKTKLLGATAWVSPFECSHFAAHWKFIAQLLQKHHAKVCVVLAARDTWALWGAQKARSGQRFRKRRTAHGTRESPLLAVLAQAWRSRKTCWCPVSHGWRDIFSSNMDFPVTATEHKHIPYIPTKHYLTIVNFLTSTIHGKSR